MSAVPAEGGFDLLVGLGSDPVLVWVVRSFLALVFVRALVAKLRSPAHFVSAIRGYELLPTALSGLVAVFLLAAELAVVPALLVPALARGACLGAGALLLLYAGAMGINLARGRRDVDCGCAGPAKRQAVHEWLLARNLLYVAMAWLGAASPGVRSLAWLDGVTIVLAVVSLGVLAIAFDALAALAPSPSRAGGRA